MMFESAIAIRIRTPLHGQIGRFLRQETHPFPPECGGADIVLIIADRKGLPIACSFYIKDSPRPDGRHWGTLEYVPGLHLETCYQQDIEYAIAKGLQVFEGDAQGEHKLARGLVPTATHSWHWLENEEFRDAVDRFPERETDAIGHYMDDMEGPFRRARPPPNEPTPPGQAN